MKGRIVRRPRAKRDLLEHFAFIGEYNEEAAYRFLEAAEASLKRLAQMPRLGSLQHFTRPELAGTRRWPVRGFGNYLIFYQPARDGIEVIRVLHGARDIWGVFETEETE